MSATAAEVRTGELRVEHVMGMPITIDVRDPTISGDVLDQVFEWLRFVDATFSTYRPESQISRLNRGELTLAQCHAAVRSVLAQCDRLRQDTDGYFDARAAASRLAHPTPGDPPEGGRAGESRPGPDVEPPLPGGAVDPSGLVKGWSIAGGARLLDRAGARNYCLNAGGDVIVRGSPAPGAPWKVGIQHPRLRKRLAAVVAVRDLAVATSGTYERGEHIIDPRTGAPPTDVLSVTVVGPDMGRADAYATAAYAMGATGPAWTAGLIGYGAMTILADETTLTTPLFDRCLA